MLELHRDQPFPYSESFTSILGQLSDVENNFMAEERGQGLARELQLPSPGTSDNSGDELAKKEAGTGSGVVSPIPVLEMTEEQWSQDPHNPWNWEFKRKVKQMLMISSSALLASISTSIASPARVALMEEFHVSSIVAILPLTFYVLALGFGPVVGGPLSETLGRYPVYLASVPIGAFFAMGAGFIVHSDEFQNFAALCFLRFMSGFCWGPVLAIAAGSLSDVFPSRTRGLPSAIFILMPFLGPGLGPVIGSFLVTRQGWRWTQWTQLFFAVVCIAITLTSEESSHTVIKRRLAKERGQSVPDPPPFEARMKMFTNIALVRPVRMLFLEPIVGFICLYVSAEFGTLFSFFAAVPYTFGKVYHFSLEQSGLVFLSIVIGCLLGFITILLCDVFLYRKQVARHPPNQVPPEHRLYPAMIGSIGLPVGLFWFAWTAREDISWASPAVAIIPFAWGNLCVFVSTIQYMSDTYLATVVASAASANALARYGFASVFPLFTIPMYQNLGINWATSLLGFIALALLPVPWVLFKFGPQIRERSKYETVKYTGNTQ